MSIKELDTVVVTADLPALGLKRGDLGAVLHVYSPDAFEVEFVAASGHTNAVLTLASSQVRPVDRKDVLAVRHVDAA